MLKIPMNRKFFSVASAASLLAVLALLNGCGALQPDSQTQGQQVTEAYSTRLTRARPYPLGAMNDSSERANLTERLLRMNNPNKIGYVYTMTANGQIIAMYTIKGKVSSTASQLTPTQNVYSPYRSTAVTTDSMGDDGSYGPEEGGTNGIFFFTTSGVLVEWNGLWLYSDAPLNLTTKPLIVIDETAKPSSTAGVLK